MLFVKILEYNECPTRLAQSRFSVNFISLNKPFRFLGCESKIFVLGVTFQKFINIIRHKVFKSPLTGIYEKIYRSLKFKILDVYYMPKYVTSSIVGKK